jgi:hypothetical protein
MKLKECGYLPGGTKNYYNSLIQILNQFKDQIFDYSIFNENMKRMFPRFSTERSIHAIFRYIINWGFFP